MIISTNKNLKILTLTGFIFTAAVAATLGAFAQNANAYSPYCTSAACRAAADKAEAAAAEAAEAKNKSNDAAERIASKEADIAQKEAEIKQNAAMRSDIEKKIKETEAKLERDKKAIRTLIKNVNTADGGNTPTAIDILASSESVSDVVEEDNRQESVEERLTEAAKQVTKDKEDLEQQKAAIQATINENNKKREEIVAARQVIAEEKAGYDGDAAAAAKAQANATATMNAEIAAAKKAAADAAAAAARAGGSATAVAAGYGATGWWGVNTYPYASRCPQDNTRFYFHGSGCQCTSYAGWKAQEKWGVNIQSWGNASNWGNSAAARGYRVDSSPAPYTIAYSTSGTYGHVMWVESVNANGTINLTEYNTTFRGCREGDFCARQNVNASAYRYIHFN